MFLGCFGALGISLSILRTHSEDKYDNDKKKHIETNEIEQRSNGGQVAPSDAKNAPIWRNRSKATKCPNPPYFSEGP